MEKSIKKRSGDDGIAEDLTRVQSPLTPGLRRPSEFLCHKKAYPATAFQTSILRWEMLSFAIVRSAESRAV